MASIPILLSLAGRLPDVNLPRFIHEIFPQTEMVRVRHGESWIGFVLTVAEPDWPDIFSGILRLRGLLQELGHFELRIPRIFLFREEGPILRLPSEREGVWIPHSSDLPFLHRFLVDHRALAFEGLWLLPFADSPSPDDEYELTEPDQRLTASYRRVNGGPASVGARVGLRVRVAKGARLTDYVRAAFQQTPDGEGPLGGFSIVLSTLLQMNDRMDLVNHYSERMSQDVPLKLFSLPAMRLERIDETAEHNIATQTRAGVIRISDVMMGERGRR
jgi:hypothetical protein